MATKAISFKLDESKINELKQVSSSFHITMTDAINEALDAYLNEARKDTYYRLTANVKEASVMECEEINYVVDKLSDDDLTITTKRKFTV